MCECEVNKVPYFTLLISAGISKFLHDCATNHVLPEVALFNLLSLALAFAVHGTSRQ